MSKFTPIAMLCATIVSCTVQSTLAEPLNRGSRVAVHGEHGAAGGQRGLSADGQGNVVAGSTSGFTLARGGQGQRQASVERSADGSVDAQAQASVRGNRGSADRSASLTRNADGTASAERSTTATNSNTGVTFDASASYSKGSGVTRTASCKDAAGNTVACGSR